MLKCSVQGFKCSSVSGFRNLVQVFMCLCVEVFWCSTYLRCSGGSGCVECVGCEGCVRCVGFRILRFSVDC